MIVVRTSELSWSSIFSHILTNTGLFISLSSVIPIYEHELTTNHMTNHCNNFMERVEAKIVNATQPLFDGTDPYRVYYSTFGDTKDADQNKLFYGEYIQDQK